MPKTLYGLDPAEYKHPADIAAHKAIEKAVPLNKLGEILEEYEHRYLDEIVFKGSLIRLTEHNAPRIIDVLHKAMEIMDCEIDVEVFSCRDYSFRMEAGGLKTPYIKITDAIIRQFDEPELLFLFGQMLTMINGRMLKLHAMAKNLDRVTMFFPAATVALAPPVGQWRRKAQLTHDRGGLLCCQDYECAMRYLTLLSGVGIHDLKSIDILSRVDQLVEAKKEEDDFVVKVGMIKQTALSSRNAWANERFIEMYNWYESGEYSKIIDRHT